MDNGRPTEEYGAAEASLRQMLKDALGNDVQFLPIPNSHALYHSFEDFDDGPPNGSEINTSQVTTIEQLGETYNRTTMSKQVFWLEGITIKDRLVAIYSDKGYARSWEQEYENEPQLKMGINMVVYALIQEGGIAHKEMEVFTAVQ